MKLVLPVLLILTAKVFAAPERDPLEWWGSQDASFSVYVMDCGDTTTLLDYYELFEIESNYQYDIVGETEEEIIENLLTRAKDYTLPRGLLYEYWKNHFNKEVKFVRNINFGPLNDEFDFTINEGCEVKTLLKALNPINPGKGVFVDLSLWEKLDVRSKAGAKFNYLINLDYIFIKKREGTVFTRYFNALLASDKLKYSSELKQKSDLFRKMGYSYIYYKNIIWNLKPFMERELFIVNDNNELLFGEIILIPFELRDFGFKDEIEVSNVKGLVIGSVSGESVDVRRDKAFLFRDVEIVSPCAGKYAIPRVDSTVRMEFVDGEFHFISLFSYHLLFRGERIRKIIAENGEIVIPYQGEVTSSSNVEKEITMCGE